MSFPPGGRVVLAIRPVDFRKGAHALVLSGVAPLGWR